MNKSIKIWINYLTGITLSALLLWSIYGQITKQLHELDRRAWQQTGATYLLVMCLILMMVNSYLESYKWFRLTQRAATVSYRQALGSYLAGIAFSIITPNRIGEYPGRILYLGGRNTVRYAQVSVMGVTSQLAAMYTWGMVGLIYYNVQFPSFMAKAALLSCVIINIFIGVVYWNADTWLLRMAENRHLSRFAKYGRLLGAVSARERWRILLLSVARVGVFAAQYLFLLLWMNVHIPPGEGFLAAVLFFWVMAVIPGFALTELGIRGAVSIFLFSHFSPNSIGILAATLGLWLLNIIVPAIAGSILAIRLKWIR